MTGCSGERCAGEHAGREHEDVLGCQRIRACRHLRQEVSRDERPTTRKAAEGRFVHLLDAGRAIREIDPEDATPGTVAIAHDRICRVREYALACDVCRLVLAPDEGVVSWITEGDGERDHSLAHAACRPADATDVVELRLLISPS